MTAGRKSLHKVWKPTDWIAAGARHSSGGTVLLMLELPQSVVKMLRGRDCCFDHRMDCQMSQMLE